MRNFRFGRAILISLSLHYADENFLFSATDSQGKRVADLILSPFSGSSAENAMNSMRRVTMPRAKPDLGKCDAISPACRWRADEFDLAILLFSVLPALAALIWNTPCLVSSMVGFRLGLFEFTHDHFLIFGHSVEIRFLGRMDVAAKCSVLS